MGPTPLNLQIFSGTFAVTPTESFLVQGAARALLMLDNSPTGEPDDQAVADARSHFLNKGLHEGSPLTVVGFAGALGQQPAIHVVRG
ncbi:MAG TPA: hypothetical protein VMI94_04835 [Bryobacteraceae bacterium]|nr:hypothetical protein [Bryobacteraceae bacterium]